MAREAAIGLWLAYNSEILALVQNCDVQCIRYDCRPDVYQSSVVEIASGLGLDASAAVSFYSAELIHNDSSDLPVPESCAPVWDRLKALSVSNARSMVT